MNVSPSELAPKAAQAESFLKALANRHRLMVLCELHKGEISVSQLQEAIGLSQSSLSQHLARLREDELVKTRRSAQTIFYSLANDNVSRVIGLLYEMFCADECGSRVPRSEARAAPEPRHAADAAKAPEPGATRSRFLRIKSLPSDLDAPERGQSDGSRAEPAGATRGRTGPKIRSL